MVIRQASEHSGYSSADRARFLDEPAKRPGRTAVSYTHLTLPTNREV